MTVQDVVDEVVDAIRALADPARAEQEARYLRSTREHLGVRVPEVRRVVRPVVRAHGTRDDVLGLATGLWAGGEVHERCLAAVEVLVEHAGLLETADLGTVERLLRASRTWALVDPAVGDGPHDTGRGLGSRV